MILLRCEQRIRLFGAQALGEGVASSKANSHMLDIDENHLLQFNALDADVDSKEESPNTAPPTFALFQLLIVSRPRHPRKTNPHVITRKSREDHR